MYKALILEGEMAGKEYPLIYEFTSIGREEGVDIHIPADTSISRRHAVIRKEMDQLILEDRNSTNGTFVVRPDGTEEEIIHTVLDEGSIFRVGKTPFKIIETEDDVNIETKKEEKMEVVSDTPKDFAIRSSLDPNEVYSTSFLSVPEDQKAVEEINHKIKVFYDIGVALSRIMDLDDLLEKIVDHMFEMFPAQRGYLMLFNEKTNELETRVVKRKPLTDEQKKMFKSQEEKEKSEKIQVSKTIINHVMNEKKALLSDDARIDERFGMPDSVFLHDIRATMYAPLILEQKVIGILCIDNFTSSHVFTENDLRLFSIIANQAAQSIANARLHMNVRRLLLSSIKALANAIEARDAYTRGHSERVTDFSVRIAERMEMDKTSIEKIRFAALLHDIGKIKIREDILNKPGRLTDDEFAVIKEHPVYGARILEPVEEFREILPYVYHHHERYDGKGYPHGLAGLEIPLPSRILSVADSFDAMTSDRPYRKPLSIEIAVQELKRNAGTQFDPNITGVFLEIIENERDWLNGSMNKTPEALLEDIFNKVAPPEIMETTEPTFPGKSNTPVKPASKKVYEESKKDKEDKKETGIEKIDSIEKKERIDFEPKGVKKAKEKDTPPRQKQPERRMPKFDQKGTIEIRDLIKDKKMKLLLDKDKGKE